MTYAFANFRPVPKPLDPPTELIAAAYFASAGPNDGRVARVHRERLAAAALALPDEGLPSAWYNLKDIALRYVRDWRDADLAPTYPFGDLIKCAVDAGVPAHFAWQDWIDR